MRETAEPNTSPTHLQRWWADWQGNVHSGQLVCVENDKAVLSTGDGFNVLALSQLKTSHAEACHEAIAVLVKMQANAGKKMSELLANMATLAGN